MTFTSFDTWWWPYAFMTIAVVLPTAIWRWLGIFMSGNISEDSEWLVLVRSLATAIVAAVIANLILFPTGALSLTPVWLRVGAAILGFTAYQFSGQKIFAGILVAEFILLGGAFLLQVF